MLRPYIVTGAPDRCASAINPATRDPISRVPSTGAPDSAISRVRAPCSNASQIARSTAAAGSAKLSPWRSSMATVAIAPIGFATSPPAMSGADP